MYWPRLQLTKSETERWATYSEPGKAQRAALYRAHAGELNITSQISEDVETIQISRRARVMGLTCSGDVHNVAIQLYDSAGEQYTMGFTPLGNLMCGTNVDSRGMHVFDTANNPSGPKRLALGMLFGDPFSIAPHIFEPNIVLLPNQSLSIKGKALNPPQPLPKFNAGNGAELLREGRVHVSFTIHVWEFPIE